MKLCECGWHYFCSFNCSPSAIAWQSSQFPPRSEIQVLQSEHSADAEEAKEERHQ